MALLQRVQPRIIRATCKTLFGAYYCPNGAVPVDWSTWICPSASRTSGWHDVSHTDLNEVARDQVFGREQLPLALAQHPSFYRQPLAQQGQGVLSPGFSCTKPRPALKTSRKPMMIASGSLPKISSNMIVA